ncbi:MAG: quinolinate synthase NadA [Candidatus Yanofskybacteria bacterium]|nr:quinolinate synthase NadA [Candidatus Yanofskybacteria bacterium]
MTNPKVLAAQYYEDFNRFAGDLYPNRYSPIFCLQLAEQTLEIKRLAQEKNSKIVVHYYPPPEFHEIADKLGDSLALSRFINEVKSPRVDFQAVFFMAATAKMLAGDAIRIFVSGSPEELGCSLVFGTDHLWLENWKRKNPEGILITYINSDAYTKSISDFISTSRNTAQIIAHAAMQYPGRKILVLPDKFLGYVMKAKAVEILEKKDFSIDPNLIEVYEQSFGGFNACCYVHEQFGHDAIEVAMIDRLHRTGLIVRLTQTIA